MALISAFYANSKQYNRGAFDTAKVVSALLIFALIIAYGGGYSKLWAWVK